MPGLSFVCDFNENLKQEETRVLQSLRSLVHSELYGYDVLYHDKSYFLGITRYNEYPFTVLQSDKYSIYIEGRIYNKNYSLLNRELQGLADNIFRERSTSKKVLSEWLLRTDGDFVIIVLEKDSKEIIIFNDALGRLPLYYCETPRGLCVSREIRFIANLFNDNRFDRMAIAQYLLFGYPLGNRTLFENVHRMQPATLINVDLQESEIKVDSIYTFNFDEKRHKDLSLKENADNLCSLFLEATKNRTNSVDKNILLLSGGLDSRSVAAALHNLNIPFSGATFLDFDMRAIDDTKIAEQLANLFSVPWKLFHLDSPTKKDALELIKIKNGLNSLGMSFILPFYKSLKVHYGNRILHFTGDGGIILKDYSLNSRISNSGEFVDFIVKKNQIFSIGEVSSLTNLEQRQIMSELENHIMAYPEREWQNKYWHFLHFERNFKLQFEGEDRNRFYFWTVTPFYSIPFFTYAMNCPDNMKKRYKLYQEFLLCLSPEATVIDNANWRFPITSNSRLFLSGTVYPRLPSKFKGLIRNILKKPKVSKLVTTNQLSDLEEQIEKCNSISKYFSVSELRKLENISQNEFDKLFTITSAIEEFECTESTIKKDNQTDFT